MKKHSLTKLLPALVFFLILNSCKKNDSSPTEPLNNNGTRISETTVVLTNSSLNNLVSIDNTSLTFTNTDQVRNLTPGKIIVINKDEGYLRKVVSLQAIGNNIKVSTEQARLEEVITQGSFDQEITLQPNNVVSSVFSDDKIKFKKTLDDFSLIFNQVKFGVGGTITIDGQTQFPAPKLKIKPVFNNGLESLDVSVQINASTQFILKSDGGITFGGNYTPPWAQFTFAPITVFIGVVPVLITPKIKLEFGVAAKISGKVEINYNVSTQITGGINFQRSNSSLTPYATVSQSTSNKNITTPAKGSIEGSIILPKVGFYIYSLAGPFVDFKLYGGLRDKTAQTIALYYGGNLEGGIETSILGYFNMPEAQWKTSKNLFENELATLTFNQPPLQPSSPSPNDNATSQPLNLSLGWSCSDPDNDPLKYDVYLDQQNPPTTKISSMQSSTSYNVTGLTNNTTYYWQVFAKDDHSNVTAGPAWKFTTNVGGSKPQIPTLLSPANGSSNISTSPTLSWNASADAKTYSLSVWRTDNGQNVFLSYTLTSTSQQITGLANNVNYTWYVNANNDYGSSGWSDRWNFTTIGGTPPATPTLSSPSNGATNVAIPPTLTWNASNGAASYTLQVSTNSNFSSYFYNQSGLTNTSQQISSLNNSTMYYWRVSAANSFGQSNFSSPWSFTTIAGGTPPATPTLSSPSNGETNQSTSPTLTWNASSGATSYNVQVATDNSFSNSSLIVNENVGNNLSKQLSGLNNSKTYYWKAAAVNSYGTSNWSSVWSFTTISGSSGGSSCVGTPAVTYAGKTYSTVQIGTQCWLKENLDVGTMVQGSQDQTNNGTIEKYCYNNDANNCATYGGLYQWAEAVQYKNGATNSSSPNPAFSGNVQGICPNGWHMPTLTEFQTLATTVNNDGNALKATNQGSGAGVGTNTSGFSALLAGYRNYNSGFYNLGNNTYFWSSAEYNSNIAYGMNLWYGDGDIRPYGYTKNNGFSVRCVKD